MSVKTNWVGEQQQIGRLGSLVYPVVYITMDVRVSGSPKKVEYSAKDHEKDFMLSSRVVVCFRGAKEHCAVSVVSMFHPLSWEPGY